MTTRNPPHRRRRPLPPAILTLPNGINRPGVLVFPEHPDFEVRLPATAGNILVTLQSERKRTSRLPEKKRGWLDRERLNATYKRKIGRVVTPQASHRYVERLIAKIAAAFATRGASPSLVERDSVKGTHLTRDVIIEDLTEKGKWGVTEA